MVPSKADRKEPNVLEIKTFTPENIKKYGCLIDFKGPDREGFEICITEPEHGWRIAVYQFDRHTASRLERHPYSLESFEPLSGIGVILLSEPDAPEAIEVFLLDRPICLFKGVWHEVLSISESAVVKITENSEVLSEFFRPEHTLGIELIPIRSTS